MRHEKWKLYTSFITIGIFTILISLLIACPQSDLPLPVRSPQPSLTALLPTIAQPTQTPTYTSTPLPIATRLPSHTRTPQSPTSTPYPLFLPRPIRLPIPTPQASSENYRLRDWTIDDAWSLVSTLEMYFKDLPELSIPIYWSGILDSEQAIRLVLIDAVRRFPQSSSLEAFEWRLALASASGLYETAQDQQIIRLLSQGVQEGRYDINDLDSSLLPFGFQVSHSYSVANLFGDGLMSQVVVISPLEGYPNADGGLILAIREDQVGKIKFIQVTSHWLSFGTGGFSDLVFADFTGDTQPEFLVNSYEDSGSMHDERIRIFQWQEDKFVDLTPDENGILLDGFRSEWNLLPVDEDGNLRFQTSEYKLDYRIFNTYLWNGKSFLWSDRNIEFPDNGFYDDVILDLYRVDAGSRINFIERTLSASASEEIQSYGKSYLDFLRFEEAMQYLSLFDESHALAILQTIVEHPYNQEIPAISQAAQAFLDYYHTPEDIYRACHAANWVMEQALGEYSVYGEGRYPDFLSLWGYSSSGDFCDEENAIYTLIDYWNSKQLGSSGITTLLEQAGVHLLDQAMLDVNGDQLEDEVAMLQISSGGGRQTFWLAGFVRSVSGTIPVTFKQTRLTTYHTPANLGAFFITSYTPIGDTIPLVILYVEDDLMVASIETEFDQATVNNLYTLYRVAQYQLFRYPDALEIQVRFDPQPNYDKLGETLRWEATSQQFKVVAWQVSNPLGFPLASAALLAETLLLTENDPLAAIPLLEVLASEPLPEDSLLYSQPESLYYLAWAYELTGSYTRAVQTYWQLWHTYPDCIYALIAYAKLELVPQ